MKTTKRCPICKKQFTRVHALDRKPIYCSRACANKAPGRMTDDIKQRLARHGPDLHNFKGGWVARGSKGREYFMQWIPPEERASHPTIKTDGYIQRSHYVWNVNHPNDKMQRGQIIHHMNHNSLDDRIENLMKIESQSKHASLHFKGKMQKRKHNSKGTFIS